jgi:hypothetical protein
MADGAHEPASLANAPSQGDRVCERAPDLPPQSSGLGTESPADLLNPARPTNPAAASLASRLTIGLLAFLLAVNFYRAATQSIVFDEAFTYLTFVRGTFGDAFLRYTANNHVLFSVLAKVTTGALGPSELGLRLPAVIAGGIYFIAIYKLCRLVWGDGLLFATMVAALALNPIVLDFLSAARGYGLALAFLTAGLYQVMRLLVEESFGDRRRGLLASIAFALSVASNLTFLFVLFGLALTTAALAFALRTGGRRPPALVGNLGRWFALPGALLAAAVLAAPLRYAERDHFLFGADTLAETTRSLVDGSLRHASMMDPLEPAVVSSVFSSVIVPAVLAGLAAAACWSLVRRIWAGSRWLLSRTDRLIVLLAGTMATALTLWVAVHHLLDVRYPLERTGLYFVPLFVLGVGALARKAASAAGSRTSPRNLLAAGLVAMLWLLIAQFATEFETSYYGPWRYDAGSRTIFEKIASLASGGRRPVRIAATGWLFAPSLDFYRVTRHADWLARIGEWGPDRLNYDFFVVAPGENLRTALRVAVPIYVDRVSGAILLVNRASRLLPGPARVASSTSRSPRANGVVADERQPRGHEARNPSLRTARRFPGLWSQLGR